MQLYSTKNKKNLVSLKEAVMKGLPDDNGLFMPENIDPLPDHFFEELPNMSFVETAQAVVTHLIGEDIPSSALNQLVEEAFNFSVPLVRLNDKMSVLELFHGPSLAFKDFGARFMARLMGYFNQGEKDRLIILVATSGDTGGAVASGFYQTPGIEVVILYPSGKVSPLQEKQLTTLGHNITALEVDGTFDDCQAIVKQAFLDKELNKRLRLSSANSINIARLIPQSLYYFEAFKQLEIDGNTLPVVFSVPSGNFGNLTAGILAKKMGLPIEHMIAATNLNDIVPKYLEVGQYVAKVSVRTISNAMDVGNPSNFARLKDLYQKEECNTCDMMGQDIKGFSFDDNQTKKAVKEIDKEFKYIMDPHGAVGYLALKEYHEAYPETMGVILETAHPSKFIEDVEGILEKKIVIPERLAKLVHKTKSAISMSSNYKDFKEWLSAYDF